MISESYYSGWYVLSANYRVGQSTVHSNRFYIAMSLGDCPIAAFSTLAKKKVVAVQVAALLAQLAAANEVSRESPYVCTRMPRFDLSEQHAQVSPTQTQITDCLDRIYPQHLYVRRKDVGTAVARRPRTKLPPLQLFV